MITIDNLRSASTIPSLLRLVATAAFLVLTASCESTDQFAGNLRDEIIERLEPLWDIKEVKVEFKQ